MSETTLTPAEIAELVRQANAQTEEQRGALFSPDFELPEGMTLEEYLAQVSDDFSIDIDEYIQMALDNGIPLVEQVGDDRYRVNDIGFGVSRNYLDQLTERGLLPEVDNRGWEEHRQFTDDSGTSIAISYNEEELSFGDYFKAVLPALGMAVLMPYVAPALASSLGVSNAAATAIIKAGAEAAQGGSIEDVLTAGLVSYGVSVGTDFVSDTVLPAAEDWINETFGNASPTDLDAAYQEFVAAQGEFGGDPISFDEWKRLFYDGDPQALNTVFGDVDTGTLLDGTVPPMNTGFNSDEIAEIIVSAPHPPGSTEFARWVFDNDLLSSLDMSSLAVDLYNGYYDDAVEQWEENNPDNGPVEIVQPDPTDPSIDLPPDYVAPDPTPEVPIDEPELEIPEFEWDEVYEPDFNVDTPLYFDEQLEDWMRETMAEGVDFDAEEFMAEQFPEIPAMSDVYQELVQVSEQTYNNVLDTTNTPDAANPNPDTDMPPVEGAPESGNNMDAFNDTLEDYWEANPDELQEAISNNPTAFGLPDLVVPDGSSYEEVYADLFTSEADYTPETEQGELTLGGVQRPPSGGGTPPASGRPGNPSPTTPSPSSGLTTGGGSGWTNNVTIPSDGSGPFWRDTGVRLTGAEVSAWQDAMGFGWNPDGTPKNPDRWVAQVPNNNPNSGGSPDGDTEGAPDGAPDGDDTGNGPGGGDGPGGDNNGGMFSAAGGGAGPIQVRPLAEFQGNFARQTPVGMLQFTNFLR